MIGQQVAQYRILRKIGEGVFLVQDTKLDRRLALKILSHRQLALEHKDPMFIATTMWPVTLMGRECLGD